MISYVAIRFHWWSHMSVCAFMREFISDGSILSWMGVILHVISGWFHSMSDLRFQNRECSRFVLYVLNVSCMNAYLSGSLITDFYEMLVPGINLCYGIVCHAWPKMYFKRFRGWMCIQPWPCSWSLIEHKYVYVRCVCVVWFEFTTDIESFFLGHNSLYRRLCLSSNVWFVCRLMSDPWPHTPLIQFYFFERIRIWKLYLILFLCVPDDPRFEYIIIGFPAMMWVHVLTQTIPDLWL